jgi:hypothetical protein
MVTSRVYNEAYEHQSYFSRALTDISTALYLMRGEKGTDRKTDMSTDRRTAHIQIERWTPHPSATTFGQHGMWYGVVRCGVV